MIHNSGEQPHVKYVLCMLHRDAYLIVQLALSLPLGLGLTRQSEVSKLELRALRVSSQQLRFLRVQEGESLGARPVRLHAHFY